jgi:hypothetical protein
MTDITEKSGGGVEASSSAEPIRFAEFLESVPLGQKREITDLLSMDQKSSSRDHMALPDISLVCAEVTCGDVRVFHAVGAGPNINPRLFPHGLKDTFVQYLCGSCGSGRKVFALRAAAGAIDGSSRRGVCEKFGEMPRFSPRLPSRLFSLVGPDQEFFQRGRQCELQGLGVGAFIYYRRVVENQKNRILGLVIRAAERVGASAATLEALRAAVGEKQFTKAAEITKSAMPEALLIKGHNPLALLHSALSSGVHNESDEDCLEKAGAIVLVLGELSERLAAITKDEAALDAAITTLLKK